MITVVLVFLGLHANIIFIIMNYFSCNVFSAVCILFLKQDLVIFQIPVAKTFKSFIYIEARLPWGGGGGGTLGISGWGCAARTLEPLAYTRANFSWILLPYTRVSSLNHS